MKVERIVVMVVIIIKKQRLKKVAKKKGLSSTRKVIEDLRRLFER